MSVLTGQNQIDADTITAHIRVDALQQAVDFICLVQHGRREIQSILNAFTRREFFSQQIHETNDDDVLPVLRAAALATGDARYESLLKEYSDHRSKRLQLLAP